MQIRSLLHNAKILKNSTRKLVAILIVLAVCGGAVWGDYFRKTDGSDWYYGWEVSTDEGDSWHTDNSRQPGAYDTIVITESVTIEISDDVTVGNILINPASTPLLFILQTESGRSLTVGDTMTVNGNEASGMVTVNTNTDINIQNNLYFGDAAGDGINNTTATFSGSGTITALNIDFPSTTDTTITIGSGMTLQLAGGDYSHFYANGSGSISITGDGSLDMNDVSIYGDGGQMNVDFGTVTVTNFPYPVWTGAVSSDWTDTANWDNVASLSALASENITIPSSATNMPEISGTTAVKSLTIVNGASVTITGGTFTTESIICESTGSITASGGEVVFNGADGELTLSGASYLFDVSVASGKKLTLDSDLTFKGNLDVSAGTFDTNGNAVKFTGAGTKAAPKTVKAGSNTFDELQHLGSYLGLAGNLTVHTITNNPSDTKYSINTYAYTLTFGSYSGTGTLRTPAGGDSLNATSPVTISTLEFTGSGTYSAITNVSFTNLSTTGSGTLTLGEDLTVTGKLDNPGTIDIGNHTLSFGSYAHSNSSTDTVISDGGTIINTGAGTTSSTGIARVTLNGDITVTNNGTGSLTLKQTTVAENGSADTDATLTVDGSGSDPVFTTIIVDEDQSLTLTDDLTASSVDNSGTITLNDHDLTFGTYTGSSDTINAGNSTITGTGTTQTIGTLIVGSGKTLTLGSALTVTTLTNNGTVSSTGKNLTVTTSYSGSSDCIEVSGTVELYATNGTISTFTVTDTATLTGSFTCSVFDASSLGGKTLNMNASVKATTMTLSGVSGSPLAVRGDGTGLVRLASSQIGGQYLTVSSNGPKISDSSNGQTVVFSTTDSTGSAPSGWVIFSGDPLYTWTGAANTTAWNTAANWNTKIVPVTGQDQNIQIGVASTGKYPQAPSGAFTCASLTLLANTTFTMSGSFTATTVTNAGQIKTNGNTLTATTLTGAGSVVFTADGKVEASGQTVTTLILTGNRSYSATNFGSATFTNITVNSGITLTLSEDLTVAGTLSNEGTVKTNGHSLSFGAYTDPSTAGTGLVTLAGAGDLSVVSGGTGGTINNLEFTASRDFANITGITIKNATLDTGVLTMTGDLTVTGLLSNANLINTSGHTLSFGSYSDTSSSGTSAYIYLGSTGGITKLTGTASTVTNIQFSGDRSFGNISGLTFVNGLVGSGYTVTLSDALTFTGTLTNNGIIAAGANTLSFGTYTAASDNSDSVTVAGGTIKATGSGGTISSATFNGNATINNSGSGTLTLSAATVAANCSLTTNGGSGSAPVFTAITVNGSTTLKPQNNLTAGTLTNNGTVSLSGKNVTAGTFGGTGGYSVTGTVTLESTGATPGTVASVTVSGTSTFTQTGGYTLTQLTTATGAALTLGSDITAGTLTNGTSATVSANGKNITAGSFSGTGGYNVTGAVTLASTDASPGTVAKVKASGTTTFTQSGSYTLTNFTTGGTLTLGSNLTAGTLVNNGAISAAGKNITCTTYTPGGSDSMTLSGAVTLKTGSNRITTVNYSAGTLAAPNGIYAGTLNVTSGTTSLTGTMNVTTLNVTGGTATIAAAMTAGSASISADTTVSGSVTVSGAVAITGGSHEISSGGSVQAATFSATGLGGKTLTVDGTLKVTSSGSATIKTLTLEGSSASSRLSVTGSGTINLNASQVAGKFLNVSTTGPFVKDFSNQQTVRYTATWSIPTDPVEFNGWYLCDEDLVYIWRGVTSSAWNEPSNWSVRIVPVAGCDVKVPAVTGTASTTLTTPTASAVTIKSLAMEAGMTLTMNNAFTVSNGLTNAGTIDTNGKTLTFATYTDSTTTGLIKLWANGGIATPTGAGGTVKNVQYCDSRTVKDINNLTIVNAVLDAGKMLTLNGNLTFTGALTNSTGSVIKTEGYKLKFSTYTGSGTIWIAASNGLDTPSGAGGTIENVVFTGTRSFGAITGISFTNATVNSDVELTLSSNMAFGGNVTNNGTIKLSGSLSVTGALKNTGTINCNNKSLTFASYDRSGSTADKVLSNGSIITATGAAGTITTAQLTSSTAVVNSGTGELSFGTINVTADGSSLTLTNNGTGSIAATTTNFTGSVTLTSGGSGSAPTFGTVNISSGKTLTLGSALSATTINNSGSISSTGKSITATTLKNNGSITLSGANITATLTKDSVTTDSMTLSGNVTLAIGTGATVSTISYGGGGTLTASPTVKAGAFSVTGESAVLAGTINVTNALTISGSTTISGTMTAASATTTAETTVSGSLAVTNALTATNCSVSIGGSASVSAGTFTQSVSSTGKSLTVNGTLKVGSGKTTRDTLRISGTSGNLLGVSGSGTIKLNISQIGGDYLSVSSLGPSVKQISDGTDIVLTALHSAEPATVPQGWNFCSGALTFIWKGGYASAPTAWEDEHNWTVHIVPDGWTTVSNVTDVTVQIPAVSNDQITTSRAIKVTDLTMAASMKLTLGGTFTITHDMTNAGDITLQSGDMTVGNNLTNTGTIDTNNKTLKFGSYTDGTGTGLIKIAALNGLATPTGSGGAIWNLQFTSGTRSFTDIANLTFKHVTVDSGVTLSLYALSPATVFNFAGFENNGTIIQKTNVRITGALLNTGIIDMENNNLTCGSYTDPGSDGLIMLGTETLNPGSGGTLKNIEFTQTRDFANITNLTIQNAKVDQEVTLTLNGPLTFTGTLDNIGTINAGNKTLTFARYIHSLAGDRLLSDGATIKATGAEPSIISDTVMNGNTKIINSGSGSLTVNNTAVTNASSALEVTSSSTGAITFAVTTISADNVMLTASPEPTATAPRFSNLNIASGKLTLKSDVSAGSIKIGSSATLDADYRGKNSDPNFEGYKLYLYGDLINNNSTQADTDDVVYRGFIPQSGEVIFIGNDGTTHTVNGNVKFNDFTCHEAGATIQFDPKATINVDHQFHVEGAAGNLIRLIMNEALPHEDNDKWTLDLIWDVEAGTDEHPRPVIKYAAPVKSISYSAILKGCLENCQDDASDLHDSTNVNWFDDMPTILMTVGAVGGRQLIVMFSTEISAAPGKDLRTAIALTPATLEYLSDGSSIPATFENLIDPTVPVTLYTGTSDKSKTCVVFGLTRELTWNDLYGSTGGLHVEVVKSSAVRVGTTRISYLQGIKHCSSDLAVNAARMLFGYDNYIDSATPLTIEKGVNSVRTWDQSDPISNRLHSDSDLLFQAQFDSSVPSDMKLEMIAQLTSQLDLSVIGNNYKDYYNLETRVWLPTAFLPLSTQGQTIPSALMTEQDSTSSGYLRNFSLPWDSSSAYPLYQMIDGEEIEFLFKVKKPDGSDFTIKHDYIYENGAYTPVEGPLYVVRLVDDDDITTFDLWSVMLQTTTLQRGNVTILNNVINADQGEQAFVTIDLKKAGSLTVQVLTLDGSVVQTLERGRKQPGTWGYAWDGTNGKGRPVARGMYFIRIIGPDIDETRKVMVVRD